jgi:hypothetical protein
MSPSQYQLWVSILLVISVAGSVAIFYLTRGKEGQIKLSVEHDDGYEHGNLPDPFNVTEPGDMVDGYPLDEDAFWVKVCTDDILSLKNGMQT